MPASGAPARLDSLTGLRFVAAFAVFGLHLVLVLPFAPYGLLGPFFDPGAAGVCFFFVLSGFVLTWSHQAGDTPRAFLQRRVARIYPTHVFTWVVAGIVLTTVATSPSGLPALGNLFLVSTWIPNPSYAQTMDLPSWSLCCELFFYAMFPFVLPRLVALTPAARRWAFAGTVGTVVLLAALLAPAPYASHTFWFLYWFPPVRMLEFVAGMLLALELRAGRVPRIPLWAAGAAAAAAYVASVHVPRSFAVSSITLLPFAALIAAAAQRDIAGRPTPWSTRPMVRLGTWSFAFYMVHFLVLRVMVTAMALHPSALASALFGVAGLAASVTAAALTHRFVERPFEQRLRTLRLEWRFSMRQPRRAGAAENAGDADVAEAPARTG